MVGDYVKPVLVGDKPLSIDDVVAVARGHRTVELAPKAVATIERGQQLVVDALTSGRTIYGVSTGFGALSDVAISAEDRAQLQINLLRSHAAGTGDPLPDDVVRATLLLRAQALAQGYSGVRSVVVQRLLELLNLGIHPVVPAQGSVGASGDLAPLAHLALPLIGEGTVRVAGQVRPTMEVLAAAGIEPLTLEAKEALALVNGTQVTASLAALAIHDAQSLLSAAEIAAAMSLEALGGHSAALLPEIHALRPHPGQIAAAARLRGILSQAGDLPEGGGNRPIQDRYTLRCLPQVLGPIANAIAHARQTVEVEITAVTDNPLFFPDTGEVISGGNFHGHPLALACDYVKVAIASLGTFTERRIASLVDPRSSGLPAFLAPEPGINSGYMLAQYGAASLASENKVLAHPASIDSIPTSADIEDYNSMSTTAARHLAQIVANTTRIVAIELLCATQAIDLVGRGVRGDGVAAAYRVVREAVPFLPRDEQSLHTLIQPAVDLIQSGTLQHAVSRAIGLDPEIHAGTSEGGHA